MRKRMFFYPIQMVGKRSLFFMITTALLSLSTNSFSQWDSVVVLTNDDRAFVFFGQLVIDDSYRLHVFASQSRDPGAHAPQPRQLVYQQFDNWGNPLTDIAEIAPDSQLEDFGLAVLLGRNNWIHVVWNRQFDIPFESRWMYMRMNTDGEILTPPIQLPDTDPGFSINYEVNMIQDQEGIIWISFYWNFVMAINEFGEVVMPWRRVLPDSTQRLYTMFLQQSPEGDVWACGRHLGDGNEGILLARVDTTVLVTEEVMEHTLPPPAVINLNAFYIDSLGTFHYNIFVEGLGNFYARDRRDGTGLDSVQIAPRRPLWSGQTSFVPISSDTLLHIYGVGTERGAHRVLIPIHADPPSLSVEHESVNELFGIVRFPRCVLKGGGLWLLGVYQEDHNEPAQIGMLHAPGPEEPPPMNVNERRYIETPNSLRTVTTYPNPFNTEAIFEWDIPLRRGGEFRLYNVQGAIVRSFHLSGGQSSHIRWDGRDASGTVVASGIYFFVLSQQQSPVAKGKVFYIK